MTTPKKTIPGASERQAIITTLEKLLEEINFYKQHVEASENFDPTIRGQEAGSKQHLLGMHDAFALIAKELSERLINKEGDGLDGLY